MDLNGFIVKELFFKNNYAKNMKKKSWQPFRSCLLNSKPSQIGWKLKATVFKTRVVSICH